MNTVIALKNDNQSIYTFQNGLCNELQKNNARLSVNQSDIAFNWYSLALHNDNNGKSIEAWAEGTECKIVRESLSAEFGITEECVVQEYVNRL